ncbi:MAG TPA: Tat pathway signal sequence domain protein [Caulobacteraceae bacterium]
MIRLRSFVFLTLALAATMTAMPSFAQYGGGGGGADHQQQQDDAKKKKRDQEFGTKGAPLPQLANAGPCPFVKALYDAARYVEFKGDNEASAAVAYSGEIEGISSACAYKGAEPIRVALQVLFDLGKGPQASESHKTYRYWVAVTDRNHAVLDKETYELPVSFPAGRDRVMVSQDVGGVVIPRHDRNVSGGNFEVLIGFEVTPQMAAFNRDGKRFHVDAGQTAAAQAPSPATP